MNQRQRTFINSVTKLYYHIKTIKPGAHTIQRFPPECKDIFTYARYQIGGDGITGLAETRVCVRAVFLTAVRTVQLVAFRLHVATWN